MRQVKYFVLILLTVILCCWWIVFFSVDTIHILGIQAFYFAGFISHTVLSTNPDKFQAYNPARASAASSLGSERLKHFRRNIDTPVWKNTLQWTWKRLLKALKPKSPANSIVEKRDAQLWWDQKANTKKYIPFLDTRAKRGEGSTQISLFKQTIFIFFVYFVCFYTVGSRIT